MIIACSPGMFGIFRSFSQIALVVFEKRKAEVACPVCHQGVDRCLFKRVRVLLCFLSVSKCFACIGRWFFGVSK